MPLPGMVKDGPFTLDAACPAGAGPLRRFGLAAVERVCGLRELQTRYRTLAVPEDGREFSGAALAGLQISYRVTGGGTASIPDRGPVLLVANHPFGAADGLILAHLASAVRGDVRILANHYLQRIPGLRDLLIPVDPFGGREAPRRNLVPLRESLRWLRDGHALIVFPAGEVSHFHLRQRRVTDPPWNEIVGRLALHAGAAVVPVCFEGGNSVLFNLAGLIHPLLRTALLARELINKSRRCMELKIGKCIPFNRLKRLGGAAAVTRYLRLCTYALRGGATAAPAAAGALRHGQSAPAAPVPASLLRAEIAALPEAQCLGESGSLQVYAAGAAQIPWTLREIGRLREVTFRLAGEGSGRAVDLDQFDSYYHHLFLWDRDQARIAGAYRLGLLAEILSCRGRRLYSRTLFRFRPELLAQLGPAMELGRSFICPEYQRSYAPLNLLWKGIGRFVADHGIAVLFGPVSISREYTELSRKLIVDCLAQDCHTSPLARRVKPRRPFRSRARAGWQRSDLCLVRDIELVSGVVAQLETDDKGVPVLIRQYLKLGGRFLGFNIDPAFSDVVDGLIIVDLRETEPRTLEKYLGRGRAAAYLQRFGVRRDAGPA